MSESIEPERAEGWRIEHIAQADWALEKLAETKYRLDEIEEMEATAIERIRARATKLREEPTRDAAFFESHLRLWAENNRNTLLTGKAKSRKLLHGSVGWRTKPMGLEVKDLAALLEWARPRDLVRIKEEPQMDAIRGHFKAVGEIPPGTDVKPETETFYVKVEE